MKRILLSSLAVIMLAFTGCKNISPATQRAIETQAVAAGVEVGLLKAPTARPYIAAVAPIICAEAAGTNPSPAQIVAAIQAANINQTKTPEAILILNAALGIYSATVDSLGTNNSTVQMYAGALCDGLNLGLAFSPQQPASSQMKRSWFRRNRTSRTDYPPFIN